MSRQITATLLMSLLLAIPVQAVTWHVEADGSGDFPTLQAAADGAADGDVIQLGAGRFNDYLTDPQWGNFRLWLLGDKSLTIRGLGPDQTIIGPEAYGGNYQDWGIYSGPGPTTIRIEGIRFENLDRVGVYMHCDQVLVNNCVFDNCYNSCSLYYVEMAKIWDCSFQDGQGLFGGGISCRVANLEVWDIEVNNCDVGFQCSPYGASEIMVSGCTFDGFGEARVGVFLVGVSGIVTDCEFNNLIRAGLDLDQYGDLIVENNVFQDLSGNNVHIGTGISTEGGESLTLTDNIFSENDRCFEIRAYCENLTVTNNHFLRRDDPTSSYIRTNDGWEFFDWYLDFENNYWGTIDIEEISQYILDGNDPDHGGTMYVDFLPLADGPVSTESMTLDGVKALYRH